MFRYVAVMQARFFSHLSYELECTYVYSRRTKKRRPTLPQSRCNLFTASSFLPVRAPASFINSFDVPRGTSTSNGIVERRGGKTAAHSNHVTACLLNEFQSNFQTREAPRVSPKLDLSTRAPLCFSSPSFLFLVFPSGSACLFITPCQLYQSATFVSRFLHSCASLNPCPLTSCQSSRFEQSASLSARGISTRGSATLVSLWKDISSFYQDDS